jgi:hypothetical protein
MDDDVGVGEASRRRRSVGPIRWLASLLWVATAGLALFCAMFGFLAPAIFEAVGTDPTAGHVLFLAVAIAGLSYATAGWLILRQRPDHAVGWLMLVAGPTLMAPFLLIGLGHLLRQADHPAAVWVILVASYIWVPAILLAGPVIAMVFPDGRLPGRRWRVAMYVVLSVLVVSLVAVVLRPGPVGGDPSAPDNPIGLASVPSWVFAALEGSGLVALPAVLLLGVAAIVVRFRRASGAERQQLKWFTFAVAIWGLTLPPSLFLESDELFILALAALVLVPAAVLVAVTRYRLYEIDTLINRTLVYVPLVGIVSGLYAACVALLQRLFVAFTGDTSDAAAVISALILATVFTPIRKSIEGVVDRRFKPPSEPAGASPEIWDDPRFEAAVARAVDAALRRRPR